MVTTTIEIECGENRNMSDVVQVLLVIHRPLVNEDHIVGFGSYQTPSILIPSFDYSSQTMSNNPPQDDRKQRAKPEIAVGTRLEVWSPGQAQYLPGELVQQYQRDHGCWKIHYDDTTTLEDDWISLRKASWRMLYPEGSPEALKHDLQKARLATLTIGNRVLVQWQPLNHWFYGTIKDIKVGKRTAT
jgi:hypothetical protein